jgi:hypothetical protein
MNRTSAAVCPTRDRSTAFSTEMTRGSWPGAPGWTIGGPDSTPALRHETAVGEAGQQKGGGPERGDPRHDIRIFRVLRVLKVLRVLRVQGSP